MSVALRRFELFAVALAAGGMLVGCAAGEQSKARAFENLALASESTELATSSSVPTSSSVLTTTTTAAVSSDTSVMVQSSQAVASKLPVVAGGATSPQDLALVQIQTSVGEGDICAVYDAITQLQLTATSAAAWGMTLETVANAMVEAKNFVPSGISSDWATLTLGTQSAVDGLARKQAMKEVVQIYEDPELMAAEDRIDTWMGTNCGDR
jgi:hypothetical protein